jgi:hypothetical protein
MFKEHLIGDRDTLTNILHSLRSNLLPERFTLSKFGDMTLKCVAIQVLAPHSVVPFVKCDAMVINHPGGIDVSLEVFISVALI